MRQRDNKRSLRSLVDQRPPKLCNRIRSPSSLRSLGILEATNRHSVSWLATGPVDV